MPHPRPHCGRIYRNYHEFGSANKLIPCRNDRMPTTNAQHEPRDERYGTW
jgi:hypothetical protein